MILVDDAARLARRAGFSPQPSRMAFTFIAPTGFDRPETRAHVRLLGPCFKTGRMEPYGRQHPRRVVCEHRPIDRQQFERTGVPSATVDMPDRSCESPARRRASRITVATLGGRAVRARGLTTGREGRPTFLGSLSPGAKRR